MYLSAFNSSVCQLNNETFHEGVFSRKIFFAPSVFKIESFLSITKWQFKTNEPLSKLMRDIVTERVDEGADSVLEWVGTQESMRQAIGVTARSGTSTVGPLQCAASCPH